MDTLYNEALLGTFQPAVALLLLLSPMLPHARLYCLPFLAQHFYNTIPVPSGFSLRCALNFAHRYIYTFWRSLWLFQHILISSRPSFNVPRLFRVGASFSILEEEGRTNASPAYLR